MMPNEEFCSIKSISEKFESPILILSTVVGRGVFTIGEALEQQLSEKFKVTHKPIEELVSEQTVSEDLKRYKFISNRLPWLLYLIYKVPIFYYRKYAREKWFSKTDVPRLRQLLEAGKFKTVVCLSHRPAFWTAVVQRRSRFPVRIWCISIEFGRNLGWQYQFWDQMEGMLSPVSRKETGIRLPRNVQFYRTELPAREEFSKLSRTPGDPNAALLICGAWGQGPLSEITRMLTARRPELLLYVVCGDNQSAYKEISRRYAGNPKVRAYGTVPSILPYLRECGSLITKPGISTLLEGHAAQRKIFLLKGMPVAEDNNASYAVRYMDAEWFTPEAFDRWRGRNENRS
jgi:UDP-N-acetylglucosamine:LPS N-acetylglucosamine transferase